MVSSKTTNNYTRSGKQIQTKCLLWLYYLALSPTGLINHLCSVATKLLVLQHANNAPLLFAVFNSSTQTEDADESANSSLVVATTTTVATARPVPRPRVAAIASAILATARPVPRPGVTPTGQLVVGIVVSAIVRFNGGLLLLLGRCFFELTHVGSYSHITTTEWLANRLDILISTSKVEYAGLTFRKLDERNSSPQGSGDKQQTGLHSKDSRRA